MTDIVINSKKRLLWPRLGFSLNVGRNVVAAVPNKCVRKLEQLRKGGVISVEQSDGARLSSPLPVVETKSSRTAQPIPEPSAPPQGLAVEPEFGAAGNVLEPAGEGEDSDGEGPDADDAKGVLEAGAARQKRGGYKRR